MTILDRLRDREILRTNDLGAVSSYQVGDTFIYGGRRYRVTRRKRYPTAPWSTIIVYGVPA